MSLSSFIDELESESDDSTTITPVEQLKFTCDQCKVLRKEIEARDTLIKATNTLHQQKLRASKSEDQLRVKRLSEQLHLKGQQLESIRSQLAKKLSSTIHEQFLAEKTFAVEISRALRFMRAEFRHVSSIVPEKQRAHFAVAGERTEEALLAAMERAYADGYTAEQSRNILDRAYRLVDKAHTIIMLVKQRYKPPAVGELIDHDEQELIGQLLGDAEREFVAVWEVIARKMHEEQQAELSELGQMIAGMVGFIRRFQLAGDRNELTSQKVEKLRAEITDACDKVAKRVGRQREAEIQDEVKAVQATMDTLCTTLDSEQEGSAKVQAQNKAVRQLLVELLSTLRDACQPLMMSHDIEEKRLSRTRSGTYSKPLRIAGGTPLKRSSGIVE